MLLEGIRPLSPRDHMARAEVSEKNIIAETFAQDASVKLFLIFL